MTTLEKEQKVKETLRSLLDELAKIKPEALVRRDELGKELSFEPGLHVFERTLNLFRDLKVSNLDNIAYNILNNLNTQTADALKKFKEIQSFSAGKQPNPGNIRDGLINSLRDGYDGYFLAVSPVIAYSIRKGTDFEALEKRAQESVARLEQREKESVEKIDNTKNEMETILQKAREAAAEVGVAQHAIHFREEAVYHAKTSMKWLGATIAFGALTILWGILSFYIHPFSISDPPKTVELIHSIASKFIILSVLYYMLVWSARNYSAHRHNLVVNKHRQNALSTFETFVKAAGGSIDTKNAVLLESTRCIFSPRPSGHIHKGSEPDSSSKIIELIKGISSSEK